MIFRILCAFCPTSARAEVREDSTGWLASIALALAAMSQSGWVYRNGRIGKSVCTMLCPKCRPAALRLDADFPPAEVQPGTWKEDEELCFPSAPSSPAE